MVYANFAKPFGSNGRNPRPGPKAEISLLKRFEVC